MIGGRVSRAFLPSNPIESAALCKQPRLDGQAVARARCCLGYRQRLAWARNFMQRVNGAYRWSQSRGLRCEFAPRGLHPRTVHVSSNIRLEVRHQKKARHL